MYYVFQDCVSVALGIHHAKRMHHIVIYGLSSNTVFLHIISYSGMILEKKVTENEFVF